jgi:hypothetical protein
LELRAEGQCLNGHEPGEQERAAEARPPRSRRTGDVLSTGTERRPVRSLGHPVDMELAGSAVGREVPSPCEESGPPRAPRASSEDPSCRRR